MANIPPLPESLDNYSYRLCIGRPASPSATSPEYYVPLIPLDILPPWLSVSGFPRRIYLSDENVGRWFTVANVPFPEPFVPVLPLVDGREIEYPPAVSAHTKSKATAPRTGLHTDVQKYGEHESDDDDDDDDDIPKESPGGVLLAPFAQLAPVTESSQHPARAAQGGSKPTPDPQKQDTRSSTNTVTTKPCRLSSDTATTTTAEVSDACSTSSGYATAGACLGESCTTILTAGTLVSGTLAAAAVSAGPISATPDAQDRGQEEKDRSRELGDKTRETGDKPKEMQDKSRDLTEKNTELNASAKASVQKRSSLWSSMHRCDSETSPFPTSGNSSGNGGDSGASLIAATVNSQPKADKIAATTAGPCATLGQQLLTQQHRVVSLYAPSQMEIRPQPQVHVQPHMQAQPELLPSLAEPRSRRRSHRGGRNRRSGPSTDPARSSLLLSPARFHQVSGILSASAAAAAAAAAAVPAKKKTEFCRQWCHTGDCSYASDCVYLHAMPQTLDGLRSVGLSERPAWHCLTYALMEGRKRSRALTSPPPPPPQLLLQKQTSVSGSQRQRQPNNGRRRCDSAATRNGGGNSANNGGGAAQTGQSMLARTLETFDVNLTKHVRERDAARKKAERCREATLVRDGRAGGGVSGTAVAAAAFVCGRGGTQNSEGRVARAGDVGNLIDL